MNFKRSLKPLNIQILPFLLFLSICKILFEQLCFIQSKKLWMAWKSMGVYAAFRQNSVWLLAGRVGLVVYCKLHGFLGAEFNIWLIYWNSEYTWGVFWSAYFKSRYLLHGLLKVGANSQVHSTMQPHETVVSIQWRSAKPSIPDVDTVTAATT